MRAVTITLTEQAAPSNGLLKPGHYVDVYLTPRIDAANDARLRGGMTLTLFRGVRLLAIMPGEPSDEPSGLATLELTPEQSTALILAREKGHLALSYNPEGKGNGGVALKNSDRATFDEILGVPAPAAAPTTNCPTTVDPAPQQCLPLRSTKAPRDPSSNSTDAPRSKPFPRHPRRPAMSTNAPLWTRKSPAKSLPVPAAVRFAGGSRRHDCEAVIGCTKQSGRVSRQDLKARTSRCTRVMIGLAPRTRSDDQKSFQKLKTVLERRIVEAVDLSRAPDIDSRKLRDQVKALATQVCASDSVGLPAEMRETMVDGILAEIYGFGPLEALMNDPEVSDVLVNGPDNVCVERNGVLEETEIRFADEAHLRQLIERLVRRAGRRISERSPVVEAQLPDGSLLNVVLTPPAVRGPMLSLRRGGPKCVGLEDLLRRGSFGPRDGRLPRQPPSAAGSTC